jgi:hypothetical protein
VSQSAISKAAAAMGRKGGAAKVPKGFASPRVQRRAQRTRELNRAKKKLSKTLQSEKDGYKCKP